MKRGRLEARGHVGRRTADEPSLELQTEPREQLLFQSLEQLQRFLVEVVQLQLALHAWRMNTDDQRALTAKWRCEMGAAAALQLWELLWERTFPSVKSYAAQTST